MQKHFTNFKSEQDQKEFKKKAVELAKAHSLCAASDVGKSKVFEVSYFKTVLGLAKLKEKELVALSKREIEARLHQMLERSIISEEVIDVFEAMGIKQPEVSILSGEFLNEVWYGHVAEVEGEFNID
jgi:type I restriction enzyme R subunit